MALRRPVRFAVLLVVAAPLLAAGLVPPGRVRPALAEDVVSVWPPSGPLWETDPEAAFELARKEKKGVLVYIATEACPHCKVMAREVWPKPEVIAASVDAVFLAVYRWSKSDGATGKPASETTDSEWAKRLDVMAYPQIRLLDGWGRPSPKGQRFTFARTPAEVVAAAREANSLAGDTSTRAAPAFPAALVAKLTSDEKKLVTSVIGATRARAWMALLGRGGLERALLLDLWRAEDDPVVRIGVAEALARSKADAEIVKELKAGVEGDHDYVRRACLRALASIGGKDAVAAIGDAVAAAIAPGAAARFRNPNNVLIATLDAALELADPSHVDVLGQVVALRQGNNSATVVAVKALAAIGKASGIEKVRKHLEAARTIEGPVAKQIRDVVVKALGK